MTDYLSSLPIDLFIYNITFLPFKDVQSLCSTNNKLHSYCNDERYKNYWKLLIDNTFSSVYGYENKLEEIRDKLNIDQTVYNYLVYVHLIEILDPLTQLMVYHKQGDFDSFSDTKYSDYQRYLALFLLKDKKGMLQYKYVTQLPYEQLLDNTLKNIGIVRDTMLFDMAINGNIEGTKYFLNLGAQVNSFTIENLVKRGLFDVLKYLLENAEIKKVTIDGALIFAANQGSLNIAKLLLDHEADIHYGNDYALEIASYRGNLDMVKFLVNSGATVTNKIIYNTTQNEDLDKNTRRDIINYLRENK